MEKLLSWAAVLDYISMVELNDLSDLYKRLKLFLWVIKSVNLVNVKLWRIKAHLQEMTDIQWLSGRGIGKGVGFLDSQN